MFFRTDDGCVWHSESPYPIRRVALRAGLPRAHPSPRGYQDLGAGARDDTAAESRLRDAALAGGAKAIEDQAVDVPALDEREAGRRRTASRTAQRLVARLIDLIERELRAAGRVVKRRKEVLERRRPELDGRDRALAAGALAQRLREPAPVS